MEEPHAVINTRELTLSQILTQNRHRGRKTPNEGKTRTLTQIINDMALKFLELGSAPKQSFVLKRSSVRA